MADFDVIRDQTLMFFLDHLIGKGQSRTLHDLSCQFGAKGFTKEMRQIAGGSQAGLKKFLLKFPSLFTIDGETVLLTPLISDHDGSAVRDYTKETTEFFTEKLNSYGIAEVPLKSLFGHRSQASSEIRHVSGQNVKEFREFLEKYSSIFVVRDDYVVLKSVLDQLEQDGHNNQLRRMPEEIQHDPYLMQQLVQDLEDKVYSLTETYSNKISIDLLYNAMQSKEQLPALWNDFIKVPTDLITFLHMNSRIFLVQGQMVSLTNERLTVLRDKKQQIQLEPDQYSSQSQIQQQSPSRKVQQQNVATSSSSSSSNGRMARTSSSSQQSAVNQRIRSQIIKIVSQGCHNSPSTSSLLASDHQNYRHFPNNNDEPLSIDNQNDSNQYDSIDLQLIKPRIVVKNKDCEMIVDEIFASSIGGNCPVIGFDVEGVNLGTSGEVTLIQISYKRTVNRSNNSSIQIVLFDVFLNPTMIQNGLKRLLESEDIVKVGHDVRTNSVSLYRSFGITLKNVFDTQVAHLIIQQQSTGRPAYKPTKYISFYTLCNVYGGLNLNPKQKDRLHKIYRKDYKYWKNRPLIDEMIQFAVTEVYALYPTVYENLSGQIRTEYEPLFKQLVYESVFAYINIDEIKQLKRQRKFELELTDLKLKLFNNDKKKIVLSNREIRLLRYIDITEEIRNKIEGPMNVAKKLKRFENRKHNGINGEENNKSVGESDSDVGDSDVECYIDTENRVLMDDYYYSEKQTSSLSPSSREYDHSGEFNSSGIGLESQQCCHCHCHRKSSAANKMNGQTSLSPILSLEPHPAQSPQSSSSSSSSLPKCDIGTQTLSTGDIVITKIYQLNHGANNMHGPLSK
ncbi:hypothetical protein DERF_002949 [Dermatophagoides farinae]|uniref:Egalitarian-like protein n=2 Tax=Dermatophagoides farinae TaxID=6954 RepID=A0A922IDB8_DERFA|nr:egalitarian protein homolog isoform X3 [Dermatophagoides farinae]XP_046910807.1 egalitarian protein homolog isoform X3 [Dermatophagoides farinae]XP_046910809.1 egalitarian protein homolog isoform X3 [Dermatophagoides farinae]KAH7641948.1 egalitarian-like protein [Dermatophagoides farinae]KAH9529040.1 hypothetical protein DERF_002949 [Dermatophagoides farinae]